MTTPQQPTPGPWEVLDTLPYGEDEAGELSVVGPPYLQPDYPQSHHLEPVRDTVCVLGFSAHRSHKANARLIAAAPDLLAACEASRRLWRKEVVTRRDAEEVMWRIDNTIAKTAEEATR